MEIQYDEMELGNEQIETIAFSIYKDIRNYVKQHTIEYTMWEINKDLDNYVYDFENGFVKIRKRYKYKLCEYTK